MSKPSVHLGLCSKTFTGVRKMKTFILFYMACHAAFQTDCLSVWLHNYF